MAALTLVILCSMWWIYFDDVAGSRIRPTRLGPFVWVQAHLPLTMAVTAVGVSIKKAVTLDPFTVGEAKVRWLLCGSLAFALLMVGVIDAVTERRQAELGDRQRVRMRVVSAIFVLLIVPAGAGMDSWVFLAFVAAACFMQVLFDLSMAPLMEDREAHDRDAQRAFDGLRQEAPASVEEAPAEPPRPRRRDISEAVRRGAPSELRTDLYAYFMEGSWARLFANMGVIFVFANALFAALYLLEPEGVSDVRPGHFFDAFSFSVQTMSTVGYGSMSPTTTFAHSVSIVEAAMGLLGAALATGLVFAKASRPRSSVMFSDAAVVTTRHGAQTLMMRAGNARGNDLVEATVRVVAVIEEVTPEGETMRVLHDLALKREMTPLFVVSWTIMHPLDESSPLFGVDEVNADERLSALVVTMTAYDSTYGQTIHARTIYYPEDLRFGHRFVDIIDTLDDGRLLIDYEKFHHTEPQQLEGE